MTSFVYFFVEEKFFKIGKSVNPNNRYKLVCPDIIKDLSWAIGFESDKEALKIEKMLHSKFESINIPKMERYGGTEFFCITGLADVRNFIDNSKELLGYTHIYPISELIAYIPEKNTIKIQNVKKNNEYSRRGFKKHLENPSISKDIDFTEPYLRFTAKGFNRFMSLNRAASAIFEIICKEIVADPSSDRVSFSRAYLLSKGVFLQERAYHRGLRQLLEKEFIFSTLMHHTYFINHNYLSIGRDLPPAKIRKTKTKKLRKNEHP